MFDFFSPSYDPERDIPDQTGKIFLITGAKYVHDHWVSRVLNSFGMCSAGIITKQLAAKGATVYLGCRSEERALASIDKLEDELPAIQGLNRLQFLQVDMSSMRSVKRAADEFLKRETRLDVLCT